MKANPFKCVSCSFSVQVIDALVTNRFRGVIDKPILSVVPRETMKEFWLPLTAFNIGRSAKNGCAWSC